MESFFYDHPVFRFDEFADWKKKHASGSNNAAYQAIQYYLKTKRILRIKKELYAVISPNAKEKNIIVDPYLIAGKATIDSILGLHTALEIHGHAYSSFQSFYFLSQKKAKDFAFNHQNFEPIKTDKTFNQMEVEIINRQGVDIRITTLARTFVDMLDRVEQSGGWEEVLRSLSTINNLNIDRVIDYCIAINRAVLNAKVGWCLEQRQGIFAPSDAQLNRLLRHQPKNPYHCGPRGYKPMTKVKRWNLMLPMRVANRSWEDPMHDI